VSEIARRTLLGALAIGGVAVATGCGSEPVASNPGLTAENPANGGQGTKDWFIKGSKRASTSLIEAYTPQASALPGDRVPVHVSTSASQWTLEAFRIGDYDGLGGVRIAQLGPFDGAKRSGAKEVGSTHTMVAGWPVSAEIDTTGWPPGFYLVHAIANNKRTEFPLVIRSASSDGAVAMIGSATTWQAYNLWGGKSLYGGEAGELVKRSYAVSLDRPYDKKGRSLLYAFEIPLVRVAEESGVPLAWMTNIDITLNPNLLDGAVAAVSGGHDEYWSIPYRDALTRLRDAGGNLAFFGANGCYWRVRIPDSGADAGKLVTCYKSAALDPVKDSPQTTARWRDAPYPKPENMIIGQLYDAFPAAGAMAIRDPDFFLFADTGATKGSKYPGLIGPETDRYYDVKTTPRPIQIPALSEFDSRGKKTWSTVTYYSTDSGAGVFATGTMGWVRALPRPNKIPGVPAESTAFAKQVTLNVLREMAKGPLGKSNPATDDSKDVNLPTTNTTGSA
jgi:hypothetical protein